MPAVDRLQQLFDDLSERTRHRMSGKALCGQVEHTTTRQGLYWTIDGVTPLGATTTQAMAALMQAGIADRLHQAAQAAGLAVDRVEHIQDKSHRRARWVAVSPQGDGVVLGATEAAARVTLASWKRLGPLKSG